MTAISTFDSEEIRNRLKEAGLRPTRQRMQLAALLWSNGHRHATAETLHRESAAANIRVSLATVYNTLHQFTTHKLLREIVVDQGCSYFDTNTEPHHHFLCEETGKLADIPASAVRLEKLPAAPEGMEVRAVDVIIRLTPANARRA